MVKETVKYEDFDGIEREKDLYFHLTDAEIALLNLKNNGAFENINDDSLKTTPVADQVELFEKVVGTAYGQKLPDGTFIKNETIKQAFMCSPEYSAFLMKIINGEINAQQFILNCFSKSISKKIKIDEDGKVSAE